MYWKTAKTLAGCTSTQIRFFSHIPWIICNLKFVPKRFWSDWADAQADVSLYWRICPKVHRDIRQRKCNWEKQDPVKITTVDLYSWLGSLVFSCFISTLWRWLLCSKKDQFWDCQRNTIWVRTCYLWCTYLSDLDTPGRFFCHFYKEDNFCDFLFAFLHIDPFWKGVYSSFQEAAKQMLQI